MFESCEDHCRVWWVLCGQILNRLRWSIIYIYGSKSLSVFISACVFELPYALHQFRFKVQMHLLYLRGPLNMSSSEKGGQHCWIFFNEYGSIYCTYRATVFKCHIGPNWCTCQIKVHLYTLCSISLESIKPLQHLMGVKWSDVFKCWIHAFLYSFKCFQSTITEFPECWGYLCPIRKLNTEIAANLSGICYGFTGF